MCNLQAGEDSLKKTQGYKRKKVPFYTIEKCTENSKSCQIWSPYLTAYIINRITLIKMAILSDLTGLIGIMFMCLHTMPYVLFWCFLAFFWSPVGGLLLSMLTCAC